VIITNQNGVNQGYIDVSFLEERFRSLTDFFKIDMIFLAALKKDHFRKPNIGSFEYLKE
jgi:histidinol phosphatase-like enzyme